MLQETKPSLPCKVKTQMSFPKASFFFFPKALLKPRESKRTHNETPNKVTETDKFTEGPSRSNVQEGKPKAVLTSGASQAQKHGGLSSPHLAGMGGVEVLCLGAMAKSDGIFNLFKYLPCLLFGCGPPIGPIWSQYASLTFQPHTSSPTILQMC